MAPKPNTSRDLPDGPAKTSASVLNLRCWTALGAAILLAIFGTEMAVFDGIKSPLDYSVFSASAGALLLASRARGQTPSRTHD